MEVTIKEQNGRLKIALCGDFDNTACEEVEKASEQLFKRTDCDLVVDCEQLNYICSTGLRLLLKLYRHQRNAGRRAILTHMNKDVRDIFDFGGYLTLYEVE